MPPPDFYPLYDVTACLRTLEKFGLLVRNPSDCLVPLRNRMGELLNNKRQAIRLLNMIS